jgi:hypothetical protein
MYYLTYYFDREIVSNKVTYFTQSLRWLFCASFAAFTSPFSRQQRLEIQQHADNKRDARSLVLTSVSMKNQVL